MIKKFDMPKNCFINANYIDETICDAMMDFYDKNYHLTRVATIAKPKIGDTGRIVDKDTKDSRDLQIQSNFPIFPFNLYKESLQECLNDYLQTYQNLNTHAKFDIFENINIQRYPVNGGFKVWHSERSQYRACDRLLVFMTYLNDVPDGGTEFRYQKLTMPAKKGLTLIWPAEWTHEHRGIVSSTQEKTIITGWYSFEKPEHNNPILRF